MSDPYTRFGGVGAPKIRAYILSSAQTRSTNYESQTSYESFPENYRWFRQDELVRRCIVINAAYAAMAAGFQTELEPAAKEERIEEEEAAFLKKFSYVKDYVDAVNKKVNLDQILFVAQVKRSIYGRAGFELILDLVNGVPLWLLSLESLKLEPEIDAANWKLLGFKYNSTPTYTVEEILYFTNLQLENDYLGLSDVEPVVSVCRARHYLLKEDFPEITRNLWAPYTILQADTSMLSAADEDAFMTDLAAKAKAGKSLAVNKSVEPKVVSVDINLAGLVGVLDKLEETIVRAFGTPRFLINKTPENRATAFVEFEAYIQGPIANIQRYFSRALETQWYPRLVKLALAKNGYVGDVPVVVKQVWNPIRTSDVNDMARSVASLYAGGLGILAEHEDIAFDMMGWPKEKLEQNQTPTQPALSKPKTDKPLPGQETVNPEGTTTTTETYNNTK